MPIHLDFRVSSVRSRRAPVGRPHLKIVLGTLGILGLLGCKDLTGSQALPAGTNNPAFYSTAAGALGMRTAAIYTLEHALPSYVVDAGLLTDELESNQIGASPGVLLSSSLPQGGSLDERILPELAQFSGTNADGDYASLQAVRGSLAQALGALAIYDTAVVDTATVKVRRGELYALDGYAEILLADFFCSGVPLSTFDFQQNFTYHASSTTAQVYQDAIAKEDSALALADTSTQVLNVARVLKGRALLALDSVAAAAQAVAAVPDGFQYQLAATWNNGNNTDQIQGNSASFSDNEGINGLPYLSSHDTRTSPVSVNGTLFPAKYQAGLAFGAFAPFTVGDWIEARLIQAEAALRAGDPTTMVTLLNQLRETARVTGQTVALADTTDPGTDTARVSLLFRERAFWLYLTGHRQGDLRRLIRQYGRPQDQVYPTGPYTAPGAGQYGTDVTAPIPAAEDVNPLFHGCLDRAP